MQFYIRAESNIIILYVSNKLFFSIIILYKNQNLILHHRNLKISYLNIFDPKGRLCLLITIQPLDSVVGEH